MRADGASSAVPPPSGVQSFIFGIEFIARPYPPFISRYTQQNGALYYRNLVRVDGVRESGYPGGMIALISFVLAILASPFKSKSQLEAENAALRQQLIVLRRKVKGAGPADQHRPLVLCPALPMVSIDPGGCCSEN